MRYCKRRSTRGTSSLRGCRRRRRRSPSSLHCRLYRLPALASRVRQQYRPRVRLRSRHTIQSTRTCSPSLVPPRNALATWNPTYRTSSVHFRRRMRYSVVRPRGSNRSRRRSSSSRKLSSPSETWLTASYGKRLQRRTGRQKRSGSETSRRPLNQ
jgi:hypothetical protein